MEAIERIENAVAAAVTRMGDTATRLDRLEAKGNRMGERTGPPLIMKSITDAPGFKALKAGANTSGRIAIPGSLRMIRKALLSTEAGGSPNQGFAVVPDRYDGIGEDPRRKLSLLDVLPHLSVTSNTFEFQQLDGYTNAAADQGAESATKAQAQIPLTLTRAPIITIAHFLKASRQVLDDAPTLNNYLQGLLSYGVSAKLESLIVTGNTFGSIQGLLPQATVFVPSAAKAPDQISEAQAQLVSLGWNAGLVILNPFDWHKIRSERATGGANQYVAGGWDQPAPPNIWGLPLVTTPSLAAGTAIVMAPDCCAILDREQVNVMFGYDGNDFTANLLTLLAEGRFGFAVISNGGVLKLTLSF